MKKGESLLDTVQTIEAMGVDAIVVRHRRAGAPHRVASWTRRSVVNAGDGRHEHPTQALLDAFTLRRHRGPSLDGCRVAIVGDIRNSRVARSDVAALHALGCEVTLVGPPTLMPRAARRLAGHASRATSTTCSPTSTSSTCCASSASASTPAATCGSRRCASTRARWGLTGERAARLKPDTLVMHPGPDEPRRRDRGRGRRLGRARS